MVQVLRLLVVHRSCMVPQLLLRVLVLALVQVLAQLLQVVVWVSVQAQLLRVVVWALVLAMAYTQVSVEEHRVLLVQQYQYQCQ